MSFYRLSVDTSVTIGAEELASAARAVPVTDQKLKDVV
jgi:hypothetical protein